jgi:hypothetical protein
MFLKNSQGRVTWQGQVNGPDSKFENKISLSGPIQKIQPFLREKKVQKACFFAGSSPFM